MELNAGKRISKTEIKILKDLFSSVFNLSNQFNSWQDFYKIVSEKLSNKIEVPADLDLKILIETIGHKDFDNEDEVFLIDEMPDKVYKLSWGLLKKNWDEIWSPPWDDMIIIYIPNISIILITHWDMVYYYKNPKND